MSSDRRRQLLDPQHPRLSLVRQCALVGVSRSSYYYTPQGVGPETAAWLRRIDEQYLTTPWYGSRQMVRHFRRRGYQIGRHRMRRLMRLLGVSALYQVPRTSTPHPEHRIYPYLLRDRTITEPNQVWCADITYVPLRHGFLYLVAIMDWASRKVLAWRLSNSMDSSFCVEALQEALTRYGTPTIFNTDQGSQFTSTDFTDVLRAAGVRISMDGKGRWMDNVFIERLWRSLKYECVYPREWEHGLHLKDGIGVWMRYYNTDRPHSALGDRTPDEAYGGLHWSGQAA
jgi:putative transposase